MAKRLPASVSNGKGIDTHSRYSIPFTTSRGPATHSVSLYICTE